MALITLPVTEIEIDIPDLVIGEIALKRKAKLFTLIYNQPAKSLTLTWIVSYTEVEGKGITGYSKESIADNTTMVDVATGDIIPPEELEDFEGDYCGQYDWFNYVAESQSLNVHDLIRHHGSLADWS